MSYKILMRVPAIVGAAIAVSSALTVPAFADPHWDRGRHEEWRGERNDGWRGERNDGWRGERNYGGYYRRPGAYYAAPPIIYQPRGYYQQPGASIDLNFPLRFR